MTLTDLSFVLIGGVIAAITQGARLGTGPLELPRRILMNSCLIAAIAAFSLCGLLILWLKVPPLVSLFLGGPVGWIGGDYVLSGLAKRAGQEYGLGEVFDRLDDMKKTIHESYPRPYEVNGDE